MSELTINRKGFLEEFIDAIDLLTTHAERDSNDTKLRLIEMERARENGENGQADHPKLAEKCPKMERLNRNTRARIDQNKLMLLYVPEYAVKLLQKTITVMNGFLLKIKDSNIICEAVLEAGGESNLVYSHNEPNVVSSWVCALN